jgi:hypothetical protein
MNITNLLSSRTNSANNYNFKFKNTKDAMKNLKSSGGFFVRPIHTGLKWLPKMLRGIVEKNVFMKKVKTSRDSV